MLSDPLVIPMPPGGIEAVDVAIADNLSSYYNENTTDRIAFHTVDIGPQSSKRKGILTDGVTKVTMTVSHSQSKENAPLLTDRTLIRFDFVKPDGVSGKPVTSSVYFVGAQPQGVTFSAQECRDQAQHLAMFILQGGFQGLAFPRVCDLIPGTTVSRLFQGEA